MRNSRTFRFEDDFWDRLTALAQIEGRTRTQQVEFLVNERLATYPEERVSDAIESALNARPD